MKLFAPLYEKAILWSQHKRAPAFLMGLSFLEAIVFPVMPEVMLAPMSVANRSKAIWFATISLMSSMVGALVAYFLAQYAYDAVQPIIAWLGWTDRIDAQIANLRSVLAESPWKAFWLLVIAGFTPIPLKIFTWASGIVGVPLFPFIASMIIGRGKRVYLIAIAIKLFGAKAEAVLKRWIEPIGWAASVLLIGIVGYFVWRAKFA